MSVRCDGIYVSFARTLRDQRGWSTPRKIMDGGEWYPQVAGLEPVIGTDKQAGRRARFLLMGRSDYYIDFFPYYTSLRLLRRISALIPTNGGISRLERVRDFS